MPISDDGMRIRKAFGENIRNLRISRGYSQQKFSQLLDTTQASVSAWELGVREPDFFTVFRIAKIFHVPVSSLIPIDGSDSVSDSDRQILDIIHQDPRWALLFEKRKHLSDSDWDVVFSVLNAIVKERETNG